MVELKLLIEGHKYQLANIYLKNSFSKNTSSKADYEQLVDFLFHMCSINIPIHEKEQYLNEAEVATNIFSENMEVTEENLHYVSQMLSKIRKLRRQLQKDIDASIERQAEAQRKNNAQLLDRLFSAQYELTVVNKTKEAFHKQLREIQAIDKTLNLSLLTAEQKEKYESMADLMQQTVEKFLASEENERIKMYNQAAIKSFKKALELFKANIEDYQSNFNNLRALCENDLCIYEEKYLMSTAMMYFNVVYSEILANLATDEMKYFLTELSVITLKKGLDEVR